MSGSSELGALLIDYIVLDVAVHLFYLDSGPWASPGARLAHLHLWTPALDPKPGQREDLGGCLLSEWFGSEKWALAAHLKATPLTVMPRRLEVESGNSREMRSYSLNVSFHVMDAKRCPSFPLSSSLLLFIHFPNETDPALKAEFWEGFWWRWEQVPKCSGVSTECPKSGKPLSSGVSLRTAGHSRKTRGSCLADALTTR